MEDRQKTFEQASKDVQRLPSRPDNMSLLQLYSHFKQATEGDVRGKRPGRLDFKGRAKYDAWAKLQGMKKEAAMQAYIDIVRRLQG